jgi:hypothetical protein
VEVVDDSDALVREGHPSAANIPIVVVTNPGREWLLERTLESLASAGCAEPRVVRGPPPDQRPNWDRSGCDYRAALEAASTLCHDPGAGYVLILEDDVEACADLPAHLADWYPLRTGQLDYGSLYTPDTVADPWLWRDADLGCGVIRPERMIGTDHDWQKSRLYGSQAYLLSRRFIGWCLSEWEMGRGGQDARVLSVVGRHRVPLWHAYTGLIQHRPLASAFGTPPHLDASFGASLGLDRRGGYAHAEAAPGWLTYEEGRLLSQAALRRRCLEIVSAPGKSTAALAQSAASVVSAVDRLIVPRPHWLERHRGAGLVTMCDGLAAVPSIPGGYGLVFLDGDHDYLSVTRDLVTLERLMAPTVRLACHDYADPSWPGVRAAVDSWLAGRGWHRLGQADYLALFGKTDAG